MEGDLTRFEADRGKRIQLAALWTIGLAALVIGPRLVQSWTTEYTMHPVSYAIGLGLPLLLVFLPRLVTAVGIRFEGEWVVLWYWRGGEKALAADCLQLKKDNTFMLVLELDGGNEKQQYYLFRSGFSNTDWNLIRKLLAEGGTRSD